ncbi:kinase Yak1 [Thraustotheca clavata]|uniref:Kinase Yak1 n=1 Tax=Thraustotheca clavata TaxID=74557 RepID=A0A1V9Y7D0_9STRA|nr:kinase Yak1 [Thraustotheca clavata]
MSVLSKLTTCLADTYAKCGLNYKSPPRVERRVLTKKSQVTSNNGWDNADNNIVLRVRDLLTVTSKSGQPKSFVVLDLLGQGTFGQVFRCQDVETKEFVAIKIIRNHPSYYKQALVEVHVSMLLHQGSQTSQNQQHVVQLQDYFMFQNHLCLVFELLSINLYELISQNNFRGLPLTVVRGFITQLLKSLIVLQESNIIHCDLKPENILLVGSDQTFTITDETPDMSKRQVPMIKLIDFGSACLENETVYSYIQSRFYRSPEVLLGCPYNGAIDMWSLGCISVEIFLGLPLFPGVSEYDQLRLIIDTLEMPPQYMLEGGSNVAKFFHSKSTYVLKTPQEYATEYRTSANVSKRYFKHSALDDIIHAYPIPRNASDDEREKEIHARHVFCHFLKGFLAIDPAARWTPEQALSHPFITGNTFDPSFKPIKPPRRLRRRLRPPMASMPPQWGYFSPPCNIPRPPPTMGDPYYSFMPYPQSCPIPVCHNAPPMYIHPTMYQQLPPPTQMPDPFYPYEWDYPPPYFYYNGGYEDMPYYSNGVPYKQKSPPQKEPQKYPYLVDDYRPRENSKTIHNAQNRKWSRRRKPRGTSLEEQFGSKLDL